VWVCTHIFMKISKTIISAFRATLKTSTFPKILSWYSLRIIRVRISLESIVFGCACLSSRRDRGRSFANGFRQKAVRADALSSLLRLLFPTRSRFRDVALKVDDRTSHPYTHVYKRMSEVSRMIVRRISRKDSRIAIKKRSDVNKSREIFCGSFLLTGGNRSVEFRTFVCRHDRGYYTGWL